MDDKIIDKIRKLMNLGTSCNQAEAEAAMAMAMRLMQVHNIELQRVEAANARAEDPLAKYVSKGAMKIGMRTPTEFNFYHSILSEFFFVKTIISRGFQGSTIYFVGTPENIEMATYVASQLADTYRNLWYAYKKEHGVPTTFKRSFYNGLTRGLRSKLQDERGKVQQEMGLVIVKDPYLDAAYRREFPMTRKTAGSKFHNDHSTSSAGWEAGRNINIRPGIGSSSNQTRLLN